MKDPLISHLGPGDPEINPLCQSFVKTSKQHHQGNDKHKDSLVPKPTMRGMDTKEWFLYMFTSHAWDICISVSTVPIVRTVVMGKRTDI